MRNFKIDPLHSYVGFKVKHMMITNVNGCFKDYDAKMISATEDFSDAQIDFQCAVNSITTNILDRDEHLKSPDFFDAEKYPEIIFKSNKLEKITDNTYTIDGELTIKGITKTVTLSGKYNGNDTDMHGNLKHGFEMFGTINRNEFDLTCHAVSGKGNMLIGEEIKIIINILMIETL